jgi:putative ABC transport system permease protein
MLDDAIAIAREVPRIKALSPQVDGNFQIASDTHNWSTRWRGEAPSYLKIKRYDIAEGRAFSDDDVDQTAPKLLLGATVREKLFGNDDAVGKQVRVNKQIFDVVGVLAKKGQSPDGRDQDDWVLLPYTTAMKKLRPAGPPWLDDILCSATSAADVNAAIDDVTALLRQRHNIRPGTEDDFNIRRPDEVLKAQVEANKTLSLLLVCVAAISLLVGGIGIMNVMLVSVAQRTREIGVRMAVGATPGLVQLQFLSESILLSAVGGAAGVVVSIVATTFFSRQVGWPVSLSAEGLFAALSSSTAVGLVFGFYPAWRASRLDPIDALRHE